MLKLRAHFNLHRTLKALRTNFQELVIADSVRAMAISLFSIFIPVFLYLKGYTILNIAVFQMLYPLVSIIVSILVTYYLEKVGIKRMLVISYAITFLFYLFLFGAEEASLYLSKFLYLLNLLIIFSLSETVFYSAHNIYFIKSTKEKNSAKKCGVLHSFPIFFSLFAPFVGAVLIDSFGFSAVFLLCGILMIIAGLIIFSTHDFKIKIDNLNFKLFFDIDNWQKNIIYFVQGMVFKATDFVWPFFMFLAKVKILSIGFFYLVSNVSSALGSYYTGKNISKNNSNKQITQLGMLGHGFTLITRGFLRSSVAISTLHLIAGTFGSIYSTALQAGYYKYAHKSAANNSLNREFYMNLGRFFSMWTLVLFLMVFKPLQAFLFILIIIGVLEASLSFFIKSDKIIT